MDQSAVALKAEVKEYQISKIDTNVILFILLVSKRDGQQWTLEKRYSEFDDLNNNLKKVFTTLPPLPGKTLFKLKEHVDIEKRRVGLDYYIKELLKRPDVFNSESMKQFLQLEKHAQEQVVNPPKMLGEITGFIHGLRDFYIERSQNVIFVLSSDMNVASRVDAYLTNMKMPWEKEAPPTLLAVGCLECWVKTNDENEFKYERMWNKTYPSQAICLYWDAVTSTLIVGLDEGKLNLLKVPQESQFIRYDEQADIKAHQGRVMGVFYDSINSHIHSVSEDKKYKVLDFQRQITVAELQPSQHGLTGLAADKDNRRIFISDKGGYIHVFEITSATMGPSLAVSVASQTLSPIRGIFFDPVKNYLFTAGFDQGEIGIFEVGKSGREKFTKQTASLKGKLQMREIVWSPSRGECMVGNKDGTVTVWSGKKAAPIFVIKAHNTDITKLQWYEDKHMLVTSGKEKSLKFWQLPKEWRDKKIEQQEEQEYEQMKKQENIKISQESTKKKEFDSDEDDLKGWHKM
ncbi:unnamed protein product [Paramecium pentaurelia]|uniref:PX domain-containing protein n=1 Tax=Paramecium pentaurelia TaxID=43138 RepID=A0A8S1XDJ6_9CILI|nr:unnamed protein product [Paramecium pentaurelia]